MYGEPSSTLENRGGHEGKERFPQNNTASGREASPIRLKSTGLGVSPKPVSAAACSEAKLFIMSMNIPEITIHRT